MSTLFAHCNCKHAIRDQSTCFSSAARRPPANTLPFFAYRRIILYYYGYFFFFAYNLGSSWANILQHRAYSILYTVHNVIYNARVCVCSKFDESRFPDGTRSMSSILQNAAMINFSFEKIFFFFFEHSDGRPSNEKSLEYIIYYEPVIPRSGYPYCIR